MNIERIFRKVEEEANLHWSNEHITLVRIYMGAIFGIYALAEQGVISEDQAEKIDSRFMDEVYKEIQKHKEAEGTPPNR